MSTDETAALRAEVERLTAALATSQLEASKGHHAIGWKESVEKELPSLAAMRGLLLQSRKVMSSWTEYKVWKPLCDEIDRALSTPAPPSRAPSYCHDCDGCHRAAALAEAARALVEALPKCGACQKPATRAFKRGSYRWCDDHKQVSVFSTVEVPEYPRAAPLRALVALLSGSPAPSRFEVENAALREAVSSPTRERMSLADYDARRRPLIDIIHARVSHCHNCHNALATKRCDEGSEVYCDDCVAGQDPEIEFYDLPAADIIRAEFKH